MNQLCKICDTKNRLNLCDGRDGDFQFCFRRVGSLENLAETITPFNTLHELYEKCSWLDWIIEDTMFLDTESYTSNNNMVLLFGKEKNQFNIGKILPIGFVTADVTRLQKKGSL